jgi:hypothetical protein
VIREIQGPVGPLEALIDAPQGPPRAAVVFAHPLPAGGQSLHNKVVFRGAKALARIGCVVLRFNFRGVGPSAGPWDGGHGEMDDYRAALDFMALRHPGLELWAAGFSFGSYITMTCGSDDDRVCALIGIAPPVDRYEYASVKMSRKATFVNHGERDELIPLRNVREFYARLHEPARGSTPDIPAEPLGWLAVSFRRAPRALDRHAAPPVATQRERHCRPRRTAVQRNWSRSTGPITSSTGRPAKGGDALEDLLTDFSCSTR